MNRFRSRFNMRQKLAVVFMIVALVPLSLITAINTYSARQILIDDANQTLFTAASETANSLDAFMQNNLEAVRAEAQFPLLFEFLSLTSDRRQDSEEERTVAAFLDTLTRKDSHISSYALLDAKGMDVIDTAINEVGTDKSDRRYFTVFVDQDNLRTYVSPIMFSPTTGDPSLYFSSPIISRSGQLLGVLRVRYQATVLQDLLEEKNGIVGAGSFGVLFDDYHLHLAHGLAPEVNYFPITRLTEQDYQLLKNEHRLPDLPEEQLYTLNLADLETNLSAMRTQPFFEAKDVATGADINQVAVAEMSTRPWIVAFFQPQDAFLSPIEAHERNPLLLLVVLGVAAIVGAFWMGNFLGRPIVQLSQSVAQFTRGNLNARADIDSSDEIGVLARSFNRMAEQVGSLLRGLEDRTYDLEKEVFTRKQTEAALRESEARYRSTATLTNDYIYNLNVTPDGQFIVDWMTGAFLTLTGFTPEEVEERGGWSTLVHQEDQPFYLEKRQELLSTGKTDVAEYRIITKEGKIKWIRDHRRPTWDEAQGRVVSILGAAYDYTVRKETQLELGKLAAIVKNSDDAILSADLNGIVISWNPAAERMFGYKAEEAIGKFLPDLIATDEDHAKATNIFMALTCGTPVRPTEILSFTKSGERIDVSATFSPINDSEGNLTAISTILRDITELKKTERDLQNAKEAAEAANRAKSAFLANMSHELRTPLNAILGFSQLMARDPSLAPDQQENLQIIVRSGEHLLALINDILELSKIEAGRTILRENTFDLHSLLTDLEDMFHLRAANKGLHIILDQQEHLPHYILADEGKLRQVLINLIGNAVKFTVEGGVSVRARTTIMGEEHHLRIEVEDTGPGIAPEELNSLFKAFVQTQAGIEVKEGTGLGLSISQQFVQLMGGSIRVESELGKGSIFSFDIPIQLASASDLIVEKPTRKVVGIEPGQPTYRLLVVEDREENRRLLVRLLRPFGFELREAVNGKEGIEVWEEWQPHLIWMDMRMPVMGGYEATQRIKGTLKGQGTVIIALTASAFEEDRAMILSAGCDDFISKPFREGEIFERLTHYLGVRFLYQDTQPAPPPIQATEVIETGGLVGVPEALLGQLHDATVQADLDRVVTLIGEIETFNPQAARVFAELAQNFDYNQIILLTQKGTSLETTNAP
ncbi:MAG: PAS domain S-box protein [Anaerolineales bacterium]|nr:PAS domain S-box protein [Anaerolineales bacterium]